MIKKVKMFTIICDNCGCDIGANDEYSCWGKPWQAEDNAINSGWYKKAKKYYCLDCFSFDDNDNLILREIKSNQP